VSIRVVHACAYFAPAFLYGGPPRSVFDLCRAQIEAGADVQVVTTTANGDAELGGALVARSEYEGVPVRYCPRAWPRSIFNAPTLRATVADALRDADLLHIHGLWNATVWAAAAAAREVQRPYIVSPRGMLAPAALAHDSWRKRLIYPVKDRQVVRGAARFHATSLSEYADIEAFAGPRRTVCIPNGVDLPPLVNGDARVARECMGLPPDAPVLLFLGRLHPIKRLDLLAAAFAIVRAKFVDARLVIAGPDEDGHRAAIAPLFAPFGPAVTWTGRVNEDAKRQWLEIASALVMCSNSESFGMSAAEAMAAGVPVVVTRTCPWPEIESHGTGFWVEQTGDAIAQALLTLLADRTAAEAMGRRGRALIAARYSWPRIAASLIHEYESLGSRAVRIA
jgi:glycosyltransferase involved in cell wall biosynthesis